LGRGLAALIFASVSIGPSPKYRRFHLEYHAKYQRLGRIRANGYERHVPIEVS